MGADNKKKEKINNDTIPDLSFLQIPIKKYRFDLGIKRSQINENLDEEIKNIEDEMDELENKINEVEKTIKKLEDQRKKAFNDNIKLEKKVVENQKKIGELNKERKKKKMKKIIKLEDWIKE